MLIAQGIAYALPDGEALFSDIDITINKNDKIALIGNNGAGKSTLLKILGGQLMPSSGQVIARTQPYYIPQHFGQYNKATVADSLRVADKLSALKEVLCGKVTEQNMALIGDDWTIEERCMDALRKWELTDVDLSRKMGTLSGGQKTKVFLAGIAIHRPELVLLDEPGNHLDAQGRALLHQYIATTSDTQIVVSHDRTLLSVPDTVWELSKNGIMVYGGNYDFYAAQKLTEREALQQQLQQKERALRKAKVTARETIERKQKQDARGRQKQEKAGLPTISMNTLRNAAERSTSRIKDIHREKTEGISETVQQLRNELPETDKMRMNFDNSMLHTGKILVKASGVNFEYDSQPLWEKPINLVISSGDRTEIKGANGSGKTTLIKMILGELPPTDGTIERAVSCSVFIDQDYSLINDQLTVYDQAQLYNTRLLEEHEIKILLTRFLFTRNSWNKPCAALSGGEKMKLALCCLTIVSKAPDIIILDEPTNNLDIQNTEILTNAINEYKGTLLVVSHDAHFLEQINIAKSIWLK